MADPQDGGSELLIQPLPWTAIRDGGQWGVVLDANEVSVIRGITFDESQFIAAAANSHHALVAALDRLADCAEANERVGEDCIPERLRNIKGSDIADAINAARAALKLAEGH